MDNAFKRELNLSWNSRLQANNQLINGNWWDDQTLGKPYISIEEGLANRLKVNIGDSLTFKIADQEISASILNIRSVQWDSFQPNFFIIFHQELSMNFRSPISAASIYQNRTNRY